MVSSPRSNETITKETLELFNKEIPRKASRNSTSSPIIGPPRSCNGWGQPSL